VLPARVREVVEEEVSFRGSLTLYFASPPPGLENTCSEPVIRIVRSGHRSFTAYTWGRGLQRWNSTNTSILGLVIGDRLALLDTGIRRLTKDEMQARSADGSLPFCPHCGRDAAAQPEGLAYDTGGVIHAFCNSEVSAAWFQTPEGQWIWADGGFGGTGTNSPVIPPTASQGDKKFLFMRVRFADDSPTFEPSIDTQVRSDLDTVVRRYASMSYGTLQGSYGYTPTMTLPKPRSGYMNGWSDVDGMSALLNDAKAAAGLIEEPAGSGQYPYHPSKFDLYAVRWSGEPGGCCSYGGGGNAWIRWDGPDVLVHEWGHAIGLPHANFWDCTTDDPIGAGSHVEYGNNFDNMGSGGWREFSAMFKARMNWIPATNVWTATTNGVYRIFVHDQPVLIPTNKYGLKVYRASQRNYSYWLEYRNNTVTDANGVWWTNGVGVMREQDGELLDMTPGTSLGKEDCPLTIGRTYRDPTAGFYITPIAKGTQVQNYIDVAVQFDEGKPNNPPIVVATANSYSVAVNGTLTLTANATDPDGDTLACLWDFGDGTVSYNNLLSQNKSWSTAGNYVVRCTVSDRKGGIAADSLVVKVGTATDYQITGRAIGLNGRPLVNSQIRAGSGRMAYTDSDGRFTLGRLPAGSYALTAFYSGWTLAPSFLSPVTVGPSAAGSDFVLQSNVGPGTGLKREYWTGISGNAVADLTSNARYPNSPSGTNQIADAFEGPEGWSDNYGARYRGYFVPPISGGYYFYIASDDASELWLSRDASPATRVRLAYLTGWTDSRNWTANASQKSGLIQLAAGQKYYIEALHKEGQGGDHLSVGVDLPDGTQERPIPAHRLLPYPAVALPATEVNVTAMVTNASEPANPGAFLFSRTGATNDPLTVCFQLAGTATYALDYIATGFRAVIPAGSSNVTVSVVPQDDAVIELPETVELTLVGGTNYVVGSASSVALTISDNDGNPTISVVATDPSASKTTADPGEFTIYRAGNSSSAVTVNLTFSGTAGAGTDYAVLPSQVVIPAGAGMAVLPIVPAGTPGVEALKTLTVAIAAGAGYSIGSPSSASVRIAEPGTGIGVLREYWSGISGSAVSDLTNNPAYPNTPSGSSYLTAAFDSPRDFAEEYGQRVRGYFIPPVTGAYRFYIASDDGGELWFSTTTPANRTRIAYVNGWVNYQDWAAQANQQSTLYNLNAGQRYYIEALQKEGGGGDHLSVGVLMPGNWYERPISASHLEPWVSSGALLYVKADQPIATKSGTPGRFVFRRTGSTAAALSAQFNVGGTAVSGTDYSPLATTINFPIGVSEVVAEVRPVQDGVLEPVKTVTVTLRTGTGYVLGFADSATVSIYANSPQASLIAWDSLASDPADPASFRVSLGSSVFGPVTLNYGISGTAVPGLDYAALGGSVTIPAGQTVAFINVTPLLAAVPGSSNTVSLTLAAGSGYVVGLANSALVSIYKPNIAPVLDPVADRTLIAGATLQVTNVVSDPNAPFAFTLPVAPVGANISSGTGIITWRPAISQGGATYPFTVVVVDNGFPPLSATQTFQVSVTAPATPSLAAPEFAASTFQMRVTGDAGPDYIVQRSTNLLDWVTLTTTNPASASWLFSDPGATDRQSFYRLLLGP
jgi:hypothetical protein